MIMKFLRILSRYIVGIVFVFSGFVKGVDPLGTAYRIEDYFVAYGTEWAMPLALFLSVGLSTLEFVLGVALLFNARLKSLSWVLFILMIFFTGMTFYDALYNPVPDCGCFGDAIKLTNWETFYKNVVLIIFVAVIFFSRKKARSAWSPGSQNLILILATAGFAWFSYYNYAHLPMIDFREWKVGTDMAEGKEEQPDIYVTYRNKETGETKEYLSPNYPWNDSTWMANWEFVSQRVANAGALDEAELQIVNAEGEDYTLDFIENPEYQFLVVAYDLEKTDKASFKKINELYKAADRHGYSLIVLTSSIPENVVKFKEKVDAAGYEFYYADDIILKTMIRSNPGLILMKDGVVLDKWHYNDLPDYGDIFSEHIEQ